MGVDGAAVDGDERLLAGETALGAQPELDADQVHELAGVALVEDAERRVEPHRRAVLAQQPVGDGVERAAPHAAGARTDEGLGPGQHLEGRPPGERQQENALGADTSGHQAGHPRRQRARLPGAGGGDDQQRALVVGDRLPLPLVQVVERCEHVFAP